MCPTTSAQGAFSLLMKTASLSRVRARARARSLSLSRALFICMSLDFQRAFFDALGSLVFACVTFITTGLPCT